MAEKYCHFSLRQTWYRLIGFEINIIPYVLCSKPIVQIKKCSGSFYCFIVN